jgi:hypothetical protein
VQSNPSAPRPRVNASSRNAAEPELVPDRQSQGEGLRYFNFCVWGRLPAARKYSVVAISKWARPAIRFIAALTV